MVTQKIESLKVVHYMVELVLNSVELMLQQVVYMAKEDMDTQLLLLHLHLLPLPTLQMHLTLI